MITVYTFNGTKNSVDFTINIVYDEISGDIFAYQSNGDTAKPTYTNYVPLVADGTTIFEQQIGTEMITLKWRSFYPFAYREIVTVPPVVTAIVIDSIIVTPQSAPSVNDGTATINASGGTPPFAYSLNNVDYQGSNVFTGLVPGDYIVFVNDVNGIPVSGNFTIVAAIEPPSPVIPIINDVVVMSEPEIEIQNAYKRVEVSSVFGKVPTILYNGDFEKWDGFNFLFWTRFGAIDISRVQRTVVSSTGASIPIENYALQFNQPAVVNKYLEHDPIPVQVGDTSTFEVRIGKTPDSGSIRGIANIPSTYYNVPATIRIYYLFKVRIRVGNYYLYNINGGTSFAWANQLAIVSYAVDNANGDLNNYKISFKIPEAPVSGSMVIELFGFNKVKETVTDETKMNFSTIIPSFTFTENLDGQYVPLMVDDISLSKQSQSDDNEIDRILNISDNLKYFTQKPDPIEILFGDYTNRPTAQQPLDSLYAIFVGNGYSEKWSEYSSSATTTTFGLGLARAILKSYQEPFRMWQGDMVLRELADDFSYLNIFSFDVPNDELWSARQFCLLGGDINLKNNQINNAKLAQVFSKTLKSNDVTLPAYPDMPSPIFNQDPNYTKTNGIFTEEFTQEFI